MRRPRLLLLLLVALPGAAWGDEVSDLLARMQKARQGTDAFQSQLTTLDSEGKARLRGTLKFRAPGDFLWSCLDPREFCQNKTGNRAVLGADHFLLHAPFGTKDHVPDRNDFGREHHGAEWFREKPDGNLFVELSEPYSVFPMLLAFELAPQRLLSRLPRLKLGATRKEGDVSFHVLEFAEGDLWIEESTLRIARLRIQADERESVQELQRRADGVVQAIVCTTKHRTVVRPWTQRVELAEIVLGGKIGDGEFLLSPPEKALVRDQRTRPEAHYQARVKLDPKDATAWLELGAIRMERGDWATAEEAFRKVVELRPDAPEGFLALLPAIRMTSGKEAGGDVLEKASALSWPYFHREAAERYVARGDEAAARRHYEALLKLLGEDIPTLREMARTVGRDDAERKALSMRAFRIDLDQGEGAAAHSILTYDLHPTPQEQESIVALHLEALKKDGGRPWIHITLMELYAKLGKKEESRRSALSVLQLLEEGKPPLGLHYSKQLLKGFLAEKDIESAGRLQKALAAHPHPHARAWALELEGELVAVRKEIDGVVKHLDATFGPSAGSKAGSAAALKDYLEVLKQERKLDELAAALLKTPADSERGKFHTDVLFKVAELMWGSERQKLHIKTEERRSSKPVDLIWLASLVQSLPQEQKWGEARTWAAALLERKDATPDHRGIAEITLAECHAAAGETDLAEAACERALVASPLRAPWIRQIQGRTMLAAKRTEKAVAAYTAGLEEGMQPLGVTEKWTSEKLLLEEIRRTFAANKDLLDCIEAAAGKSPERVGSLMILSVVEELRGRPQGALERLDQACRARPTWTLIREIVFASVAAGRIDRAIEARTQLASASFKRPVKGWSEEPFDLESLNKKILAACEASADADLCRLFARSLALDSRGTWDQQHALQSLLLCVGDEKFFGEIETLLAKNATDEWQRFHAYAPSAWAYRQLGMGARGSAIYERALREQVWSEGYRQTGASWIEELKRPDDRSLVTVELLRLWLDQGTEEVGTLAAASQGDRGLRSPMDLAWRFRVRDPNVDPAWLKLGAVRGQASPERLWCLEELIRRGEPRPEWTLLLAVTRLERGEEDLSAALLFRLLEKTPEVERKELWRLLTNQLAGQGGLPELPGKAAASWAKHLLAESRRDLARGAAELAESSMDLARLLQEEGALLQALLVLGAIGDAAATEPVLKLRAALRRHLPDDPFQMLKNSAFPAPVGRQAEEVGRLILRLSSDEFDQRSEAHRALLKLGAPAVSSLLALVDSPDADLRGHVRDILRALMGD